MPGTTKNSEPAIDVLAAEEFVVPAPDPALRPEQLNLPADLVGQEPHDILVAEEFAMPSPDEAHRPESADDGDLTRQTIERIIIVVQAVVVLRGLLWWRRRRKRRSRSS